MPAHRRIGGIGGIAAAAVCAAACGSGGGRAAAPDATTFTNGRATVALDPAAGTFDVEIDGFRYLTAATSAVETGTGGVLRPETVVRAASGPSATAREVASKRIPDGLEVRLRHPDAPLGAMTTILTLPDAEPAVEIAMEFEPRADVADWMGLLPVHAAAPEGDLFLKSAPADLLILQNGAEKAFDFYVDLFAGDSPYRRGVVGLYLESVPAAASNWNSLVYDRASGEGLHFGFLSFERTIPEVVIGYDAGPVPVRDGREGFSLLLARCGNILARLARAGRVQRSETFRIDRFEGRPQAALEGYARLLADRLGIEPPAHAPRAGWDSWYVYSDKINHGIVEPNIQAARDRFVPYGLNTFEVDFGWEKVWGNWDERSRDFPDGMTALAQEIRAAGMEPELWISAFNAHAWSRVGLEHPEWFAPRDPLWSLLMFFGTGPLDFTIPEVTDFIGELGERVAGWGWEAVKFDFAYYSFLVDAVRDPETTILEGYRRALRAFRERFGRERFFINIFGMGANYGLIDSMRIGIDTWPCWGDDPAERCPHAPTTTGYSGQGIRPAVKTLARRYYFNNVVWVNHPDQVFFRPPLGFIPQRSWAALVGLSGGVVSLGDDMALLGDEGAEAYRRILPNLGRTGVPQDLFEREYPEVWLTSVEDREPGGHLLHLYSWGDNWDLTRNPRVAIPEGTRRHAVRLADLGLAGPVHAFEFWTQTDLGIVADALSVDVPARDSRVVVLRPVENHPYLVASNRHVSQGGTDLHAPAWDGATLGWSQDLVAGFAHTVYVDSAGRAGTPAVTVMGDATASVRRAGALWAVDIDAATSARATISLRF